MNKYGKYPTSPSEKQSNTAPKLKLQELNIADSYKFPREGPCVFCEEQRQPYHHEVEAAVTLLKTELHVPELKPKKLPRISNCVGDNIFQLCLKIRERLPLGIFQILLHLESLTLLLWQPNRNNVTPLLQASSEADCAILKLFLDHGAAQRPVNHSLWNPQNLIARNGCVDCMQQLIKNGFNINEAVAEWSPLLFASKNRNRGMIDYLLKNGVDINFIGRDKWTALLFCASFNEVNSFMKLLNRGAYRDIYTIDNNSAFILGALCGHWKILICLLEFDPKYYFSSLVGSQELSRALSIVKHQITKCPESQKNDFLKCEEVLINSKFYSERNRKKMFNTLLCCYIKTDTLFSALAPETFSQIANEAFLFDCSENCRYTLSSQYL